MGDLSINKIQQLQTNTNGVSTSQVQAQPTSIGIEKKNELVALAEKLGITTDQLNNILKNNPNFLTLKPEQQLEIISALSAENVQVAEQNTEVAQVAENTATEPAAENVTKNADDYDTEYSALDYNFREFSKLSLEEQFDAYAEELAKNKFLYGSDKKDVSEWEALSEQEKSSRISTERKTFNEHSDKYNPTNKGEERNVRNWVQEKMVTLQAANYNRESLEEFNKSEENSKKSNEFDKTHDYFLNVVLNNLDENDKLREDATCSDQQIRYIKRQKYLSEAVMEALKQSGDTTLQSVDANNYVLVLPKEELERYCKQIGKPVAQIEYEYLKGKASSGELSSFEQNRYDSLKQFDSPAGQKIFESMKNPQNYGIMEDLEKSEFGEDWKNVKFASDEDKAIVLRNYLDKKMKSLPEENRTKFFNEFVSEFSAEDPLMTNSLATVYLARTGKNEQKQLIQGATDMLSQFLAIDVNNLTPEMRSEYAEKQKALQKENPELYSLLAQTVTQIADEGSFEDFRKAYIESGNEEVLRSVINRAYDTNRSSQIGQQKILLGVFESEKVSPEMRVEAAVNLDKAYKENQIPLTQAAIQHKECNDAMIEDGTFTRYAEENQVEAFNLHKVRCESDDYSKEEAISNLNRLSDWIPEVKNADNQLAMHNNVMNSKYSEVQEHAASNIGKYDVSVQSRAMDRVCQSGNQKAIEAGVKSLVENPKSINVSAYKELAKTEVNRYLSELSLQEASQKNLSEKFLLGNLSVQEVNSLPASQRREYVVKYFKKLPIDQKIKALGNITSNSMKKVIYAYIARTDSHFFNEICKDKDRADNLLSLGLPEDVTNKIGKIVSFLAISDVGFQEVAKKYDIEYDGLQRDVQQHELINNYTSIPEGFNNEKFNMFVKDKKGHLLA